MYYIVYFKGNVTGAFWDWMNGARSIGYNGPFNDKKTANETTKGLQRAYIVYHAGNQLAMHLQNGWVAQATDELLAWARNNIQYKNNHPKHDLMIENENEQEQWIMAKIKTFDVNENFRKYDIGVQNITSVISGIMSGVVGNVPGILDSVSKLTINLCNENYSKDGSEIFIESICDEDNNEGILVFKGENKTKTSKKYFVKTENTISIHGVMSFLIPRTQNARNKCIEIKNQISSSIISILEKDFNL